MTDPILQVKNVSKFFGGLTALDNVSLEVYPGEVVALLGDNGAGKSTLTKCISGVYQPDEGEIYFQGVALKTQRRRTCASTALRRFTRTWRWQKSWTWARMCFLGKEKMKRLLGCIPVTDDKYMRQEAAKVLERLDIELPDLSQKLERLSGGQRQAVAIARALYWEAKLMMMDEPTAALGVPEQRKVLSLVQSLREENIPVLLISHNMRDVLQVADRVVVLLRGRVVANMPRADATEELIVKYIMGSPDVVGDELAAATT